MNKAFASLFIVAMLLFGCTQTSAPTQPDGQTEPAPGGAMAATDTTVGEGTQVISEQNIPPEDQNDAEELERMLQELN